jgi:hypothetical protein
MKASWRSGNLDQLLVKLADHGCTNNRSTSIRNGVLGVRKMMNGAFRSMFDSAISLEKLGSILMRGFGIARMA